MYKISCIAVDDEPLAIEQMKGFISKIDFLDLKETFDNAIDTLNYLKQNSIDLLFLDIEMDDFTGLQLLETLDRKPSVILTTAYDNYALKSYELHVADYLLKPISYQRFVKAVNHVYDSINKDVHIGSSNSIGSVNQKNKEFVFIKTEYKMQKVLFDDILYIKSMGNYMNIKLTNKEILYTLSNFKQICDLLPSDNFIRIHKSYIIPINKIESISKSSIEIDKEHIPIGESYKQLFFALLKKKKYISE